jgi:hypothetical protein
MAAVVAARSGPAVALAPGQRTQGGPRSRRRAVAGGGHRGFLSHLCPDPFMESSAVDAAEQGPTFRGLLGEGPLHVAGGGRAGQGRRRGRPHRAVGDGAGEVERGHEGVVQQREPGSTRRGERELRAEGGRRERPGRDRSDGDRAERDAGSQWPAAGRGVSAGHAELRDRDPAAAEQRLAVDHRSEHLGRDEHGEGEGDGRGGQPPPAAATARPADALGPAEQNSRNDARQQNLGEGAVPPDGRARAGEFGHEASQARRPGESAHAADVSRAAAGRACGHRTARSCCGSSEVLGEGPGRHLRRRRVLHRPAAITPRVRCEANRIRRAQAIVSVGPAPRAIGRRRSGCCTGCCTLH